jgi:hypothetical protein
MFFNQLLQNPIIHHSQQLIKNTIIATGLMFSLAVRIQVRMGMREMEEDSIKA